MSFIFLVRLSFYSIIFYFICIIYFDLISLFTLHLARISQVQPLDASPQCSWFEGSASTVLASTQGPLLCYSNLRCYRDSLNLLEH